MNDWRFFRHRPRKAHLWEPTPDGLWRSKCGYRVVRIFEDTHPLTNSELILKCRLCIQHEERRKDTAATKNPAGMEPHRAASAVHAAG